MATKPQPQEKQDAPKATEEKPTAPVVEKAPYKPALVRLRVRTNQTGAKRTAIGLVFTGSWQTVEIARNHSAHKELLANSGLVVEELPASGSKAN